MTQNQSDVSSDIADSVSRLSSETAELIRAELRALRSEYAERLHESRTALGMLGGAGALGIAASACATAALVALVGRGVRHGTACAIVGALYGAGAALAAKNGLERLRSLEATL